MSIAGGVWKALQRGVSHPACEISGGRGALEGAGEEEELSWDSTCPAHWPQPQLKMVGTADVGSSDEESKKSIQEAVLARNLFS